ncbi:hypothetical protein NQ318_013689 [Aromia moschata]|uniref:Uncharacterized protein n=1 Tax=Aromia moschata TaxID=1265417 RepID=A0AAV8ZB33_9CUCU|nr:hypothetical protein NQ318_013689 [Aromia moschata]
MECSLSPSSISEAKQMSSEFTEVVNVMEESSFHQASCFIYIRCRFVILRIVCQVYSHNSGNFEAATLETFKQIRPQHVLCVVLRAFNLGVVTTPKTWCASRASSRKYDNFNFHQPPLEDDALQILPV